jgi:hypothetical protein
VLFRAERPRQAGTRQRPEFDGGTQCAFVLLPAFQNRAAKGESAMPIRNGAKPFLQSQNNPRRMLPERGLPEGVQLESHLAHFAHEHGTTLWLLAVGALACFLGAMVVATRHARN